MARDRSPAAVARAFVETLRASTTSDPTPADVEQAAIALVRAVRRECLRIVREEGRAYAEQRMPLEAAGCRWVAERLAALNRAPQRAVRRGR